MLIDKMSELGSHKQTQPVKDLLLNNLGDRGSARNQGIGVGLDQIGGAKAKVGSDLVGQAGRINPPGDCRPISAASFEGSVEQFSDALTYLEPEEDSKAMVTVVDKIKAQMAYVGEVYGTPLKSDELEDALGSKAVAYAAEMNQNLQKMSQASTAYMASNDMAPTLENIYTAEYAVGKQDKLVDSSVQRIEQNKTSVPSGRILARDSQKTNELMKNTVEMNQSGSSKSKMSQSETSKLEVSKLETSKLEIIKQGTNSQELRGQGVNASGDTELRTMVADKLQTWGYEANEDQVNQGQWMVEEGINLTKDKFDYVTSLNQIDLPVTPDQLMSAISDAVYEGRTPIGALLVPGYSYLDTARVTYATHVDQTMAQITNPMSTEEQQQARINLTQIQLHMSVEANYNLAAKGFAIDVEPLEQLLEQLKASESQPMTEALQTIDGSEEDISQIKELAYTSYQTVTTVGHMPAELIGISDIMNQNLASIEQIGTEILTDLQKQALKSMGAGATSSGEDKVPIVDSTVGKSTETQMEGISKSVNQGLSQTVEPLDRINIIRYMGTLETVMTTPRTDMGDSIKKAFTNVDDILRDLDLEESPENQRALRILGYNQLELTKESVLNVKQEDIKIQDILTKMTPTVVLKMIREGFNPLDASFTELEEKINSYQSESLTADDEKYSSFLQRLDARHEITEKERESYIGIYRLLYQVEKTDGAAVGALYDAGGEITMKNLMIAAKNYQGKNYNQVVSDETGTLVTSVQTNPTIIEQAQQAYDTQCLKHTYTQATPDNLEPVIQSDQYEQMNPETFMKNVIQASNVEMNQILTQLDQPTGALYNEAMEQMANNRNLIYRELFGRKGTAAATASTDAEGIEATGDTSDGGIDTGLSTERASHAVDSIGLGIDEGSNLVANTEDAIEEIKNQILQKFADALETPEGMAEAQQNLADTAEQVMLTMVNSDGLTTSQFNQLRRMHIQFQTMVGQTKEQEYSIPVMVADEMANVHLKIVTGTAKKGGLEILFETMKYGQVNAVFDKEDGEIIGTEEGENEEAQAWLDEHHDEVLAQMNEIEGKSTNDLFKMAKIYMNAIRDLES